VRLGLKSGDGCTAVWAPCNSVTQLYGVVATLLEKPIPPVDVISLHKGILFLFLFLFRATPETFGSSQARG